MASFISAISLLVLVLATSCWTSPVKQSVTTAAPHAGLELTTGSVVVDSTDKTYMGLVSDEDSTNMPDVLKPRADSDKEAATPNSAEDTAAEKRAKSDDSANSSHSNEDTAAESVSSREVSSEVSDSSLENRSVYNKSMDTSSEVYTTEASHPSALHQNLSGKDHSSESAEMGAPARQDKQKMKSKSEKLAERQVGDEQQNMGMQQDMSQQQGMGMQQDMSQDQGSTNFQDDPTAPKYPKFLDRALKDKELTTAEMTTSAQSKFSQTSSTVAPHLYTSQQVESSNSTTEADSVESAVQSFASYTGLLVDRRTITQDQSIPSKAAARSGLSSGKSEFDEESNAPVAQLDQNVGKFLPKSNQNILQLESNSDEVSSSTPRQSIKKNKAETLAQGQQPVPLKKTKQNN